MQWPFGWGKKKEADQEPTPNPDPETLKVTFVSVHVAYKEKSMLLAMIQYETVDHPWCLNTPLYCTCGEWSSLQQRSGESTRRIAWGADVGIFYGSTFVCNS